MMTIRLMVTLIAFLALSPKCLAQSVEFRGWTPDTESDLRQLYDPLSAYNEAHNPRPLPRIIVNKTDSGINFAAGDEIFLREFPKGSTYFNTVAAHEYGHTIRTILYGNFFNFVLSRLEEALAEFFGTRIVSDALNLERMPFRSRSSRAMIRTNRWQFLTYPNLWAQQAQKQEDPFGSCVYTGYCGEFYLGTYPLLQYVKTACPTGSLAECPAYLAINQAIYELGDEIIARGQPFDMIRVEDVWQKLEERFPTLQINGMSPKVFFGTSVIFGPYREGPAYSISTSSGWQFLPSKNLFVEKGPVDLWSWRFEAREYKKRVDEGIGFVIQNPNFQGRILEGDEFVKNAENVSQRIGLSNGVPVNAESLLAEGKFQIRIINASGSTIEQAEVDLTKTPGGGFGTINTADEPGLYKSEVVELSSGLVVAHRFAMVPLHALTWDYDGVFIWNIDESDNIVDRTIELPEEWQVLYSDNGLTWTLPPAGTRSVVINGQPFNLTGESQILRLNGSYRWPVLQNLPREIVLSATQPSAKLELTNINSNNRAWSWQAHREYSLRMVRNDWLALDQTSGAGNSSLTLSVANSPMYGQGEAWIYIQVDPGIDSRAIKISYK